MDKRKDLWEIIRRDIQDLHRLGYAQQLFREMGGFSNFAISFSIISILTGAMLHDRPDHHHRRDRHRRRHLHRRVPQQPARHPPRMLLSRCLEL